MAKGFAEDKAWADKFNPLIYQTIAPYFMRPASVRKDQEFNCDYVTDRKEFACRIRKFQYLFKYGGQITIRRNRPSGFPSELEKILMGHGDYMFYAFANEKEDGFAQWVLINLPELRRFLLRYRLKEGRWPGEPEKNNDKSSKFIGVPLDLLPEEVIEVRG